MLGDDLKDGEGLWGEPGLLSFAARATLDSVVSVCSQPVRTGRQEADSTVL